MKKKWFSVEQIVAVVKQAELGVPVAEVKHSTIYCSSLQEKTRTTRSSSNR
jgi:hypothetical protein